MISQVHSSNPQKHTYLRFFLGNAGAHLRPEMSEKALLESDARTAVGVAGGWCVSRSAAVTRTFW